MRIVQIIAMCGVALAFLGCSSNPVTYGSDFKATVDFANYKTYSWHAPNEYNVSSKAYAANDIVDERIRQSVDVELLKKGFTQVDTEKADFLVNYSITSEDQLDVRTYNTYNGYSSGWNHGAYYGSHYRYSGVGYGAYKPEVETKVTHYKQGTFVLDILGGKTDKLVWRGTAEARMSKAELTAEEREAKIASIVKSVLSAFPPRQE